MVFMEPWMPIKHLYFYCILFDCILIVSLYGVLFIYVEHK